MVFGLNLDTIGSGVRQALASVQTQRAPATKAPTNLWQGTTGQEPAAPTNLWQQQGGEMPGSLWAQPSYSDPRVDRLGWANTAFESPSLTASKTPQGPTTTPATSSTFTGPATSDDNKTLTAQQIDQWITGTRPNSPLAGKGAYILQQANAYGVSVPLMLGIFLKETELGTTADPNAKNLSGIVAPTDGGLGTQRVFNGYASWEDSIAATARNLATPLYKGKTLAQQVGTWYTGNPNDLGATDQAGNGTTQDYLNTIAQVYQGLSVPYGPTTPPSMAASPNAQAAIQRSQPLMGLPYTNAGIRQTGNPQDGVDCSSLVGYTFGLDRSLWNAQTQYDYTQRVDYNAMQPGDLIFFQGTNPNDPSAKPVSHVGIYLGNGKMRHAGDNGVQDVDLNTTYYQEHYYGSGRLPQQTRT